MKWCRLERNCVTGSSGSIDGTTVTAHMRDLNVFTVTMSGLKSENTGWYWCAKGDIQIPVYLTVTEKPITTTTSTTSTTTVAENGTFTTIEQQSKSTVAENKHRASFDLKILIVPLGVLILLILMFFWFILKQKQSKAESLATAMVEEEVTYSIVVYMQNNHQRHHLLKVMLRACTVLCFTLKKQRSK
ncbi:CMRF35-like molecule 4 [Oreochromis niloticus]|uniref:CMRF35-like molecule 4 n=1 Tax=Oreochromis niloticus TaxID=8128 RepID=UPI000DF3DCDE|nr:CMRF35-like molecule 4 [Oreochromis niloticus]CAI5654312.1 unnamed protein product [Mustela putorius furo]